MSPGSSYMISAAEYDDQPISRTYQYRKVMKPMLERKRRARINRCLDELKELMVSALQAEGENVSKLEKADILELTVRHLHKLRRQHSLGLTPEAAYADRFRAGFTHCAAEVTSYLATTATPATVDPAAGAKLIQHLGSCIRQIDTDHVQDSVAAASSSPAPPTLQCYATVSVYTPPASPHHYDAMSSPASPHTRMLASPTPSEGSVWRPW